MECSMKLCSVISSVPINHESVRKNLFENCGWCKLHRPADCPKRTVPSPVRYPAQVDTLRPVIFGHVIAHGLFY